MAVESLSWGFCGSLYPAPSYPQDKPNSFMFYSLAGCIPCISIHFYPHYLPFPSNTVPIPLLSITDFPPFLSPPREMVPHWI